MKTKLLSISILGFSLLVSATIIANGAFAQTAADAIQFPVAELGGCEDKDACKTYCDDADHINACLAFAEKNHLMSEDEIDTARKFMKAGGKGPGGCTGKDECQVYCDDISNIDACVAFAEKAGILPPKELAEAKQVQAAIAKGIKPPACKGKKGCDAYCEDSSHMRECVSFGEASGFLKGEELENAKKMLIAIDNGAVPPPCRGREACETYCSDPDHMEACVTFARAAGFMTPEEAQNSEKMLTAIRKGVKPPQCRGKGECDAYCAEPAHTNECIQFAVAAGFMTEKEAEMAKKTGGKGPGGCTGKDACEAFCGNPDNQETCFNFAKDNGMLSEEDLRNFEKYKNQGPPSGPTAGTASECAAYGGDWNGTRCDFGAKECGNQGGSWDGKTCNFPEGPTEGFMPPGGGPGYQTGPTSGTGFNAQACADRGGHWVDNTCSFINPMDTPEYCLKQGGDWVEGRCSFAGRECTNQGGSWDGSKCNFVSAPAAPQSLNFDLNSSLASVITAFREFSF